MNQNPGAAGQPSGQPVMPVTGAQLMQQLIQQPAQGTLAAPANRAIVPATTAPAPGTVPAAMATPPVGVVAASSAMPPVAPGATPVQTPVAPAPRTAPAVTPAASAPGTSPSPKAPANPAPGAAAKKPPTPTAAGQTPPATPAGQAAPGPGMPNPNYAYRQKPPLLGTGLQRDILTLLLKIGVVVGIVVGLLTIIFGVEPYDYPSMEPAVQAGDLLMYSRFDKNYVAQDLIALSFQGQIQVRRVVAIAGNTVDIMDGHLIIDGAVQQEARIYTETHRFQSEIDFPLTVPEGHVFVLGDNRESSTDSRIYGPVRVDDTLGKITAQFRRRGF